MGIWEQAKYPHTPLGQFLDDRLPHRDAVQVIRIATDNGLRQVLASRIDGLLVTIEIVALKEQSRPA